MLAMKCLLPDHFHLTRGNHESKTMNKMCAPRPRTTRVRLAPWRPCRRCPTSRACGALGRDASTRPILRAARPPARSRLARSLLSQVRL